MPTVKNVSPQDMAAGRWETGMPDGAEHAPLTAEAARQYLERRLGGGLDELLEYPRYVDMDVVSQCNARCVMCSVDFDRRGRVSMSDELFDRIAAELSEHADRIERVGLAVNSEPLLDLGLAGKVRNLKDAGIRKTYFSTNASLLSPERGRALLEAGLDVTYISIDSLRRERFEAIRRGLSFDTVYANAVEYVRLKREIRPEAVVRIQMTVHDANRSEVEAFVRHWEPLLGGNDEIVVSHAYCWSDNKRVPGTLELPEANSVPCIVLWSSIVICADGRVSLCCRDAGSEVVLGDVSRQSIGDIWRGEPLARVRRAHLEGRRAGLPLCDGCAIWDERKHLLSKKIE
jgi:MoaA/NifB/PqqE/SkfB family radical SAM enzyme